MCQVAVVREEQESLGVLVEPPDREHAWLGRHELGHNRTTVRVRRARHDAGGLVQQVVDEAGLRADAYAVDFDAVDLHIGLVAE